MKQFRFTVVAFWCLCFALQIKQQIYCNNNNKNRTTMKWNERKVTPSFGIPVAIPETSPVQPSLRLLSHNQKPVFELCPSLLFCFCLLYFLHFPFYFLFSFCSFVIMFNLSLLSSFSIWIFINLFALWFTVYVLFGLFQWEHALAALSISPALSVALVPPSSGVLFQFTFIYFCYILHMSRFSQWAANHKSTALFFLYIYKLISLLFQLKYFWALSSSISISLSFDSSSCSSVLPDDVVSLDYNSDSTEFHNCSSDDCCYASTNTLTQPEEQSASQSAAQQQHRQRLHSLSMTSSTSASTSSSSSNDSDSLFGN